MDCDFYRQVYLDGDPDDDNFEGGDQGYNSVLEETTQYINSLAVGYAFNDLYSGSVSERDGILTFLWYITRYLKMAPRKNTLGPMKPFSMILAGANSLSHCGGSLALPRTHRRNANRNQ